jgi:hypothetical protein
MERQLRAGRFTEIALWLRLTQSANNRDSPIHKPSAASVQPAIEGRRQCRGSQTPFPTGIRNTRSCREGRRFGRPEDESLPSETAPLRVCVALVLLTLIPYGVVRARESRRRNPKRYSAARPSPANRPLPLAEQPTPASHSETALLAVQGPPCLFVADRQLSSSPPHRGHRRKESPSPQAGSRKKRQLLLGPGFLLPMPTVRPAAASSPQYSAPT